MRSFIVFLVAALSVAAALDFSQVRPIHELPEWRTAHKDILQFFPLQTNSAGGRIVNGWEAAVNQFPYQVALFMIIGEGAGLCGGSIISSHHVLTAAHCLDIDGIERVIVSKGAHELSQIGNEAGRVDVNVYPNGFIIHESWDPSLLRNDIALLHIAQGISFSDTVRPIDLPRGSQQNENFAGLIAQISGWGRFSDDLDDIASHLRWGQSEVMTNTACNVFMFGIIDATHVCIDGRVGSATCQGDSGGPLSIIENGRSLQVGIVSFGIALGCELRFPSVFTRVTSFIDWIDANTN